MLDEMLNALFEQWIEKDFSQETELELKKIEYLLQKKGFTRSEFELMWTSIMGFCLSAETDAFKAGFQICSDLMYGRLK